MRAITPFKRPFVKAQQAKNPPPPARIKFPHSAPLQRAPTWKGCARNRDCKPGSVVEDAHLSRDGVAAAFERATRVRGGQPQSTPICPCSPWGLSSRRVAAALVRSYRTVSAFPASWPRLPKRDARAGVFFSVTLSVASPRPAVSRHGALWSPDFPHRLRDEDASRPIPHAPRASVPVSLHENRL